MAPKPPGVRPAPAKPWRASGPREVGRCDTAHYHKRSNVESTFSMIKRKFGDSLRRKTDTAQVNETLAKVLCHNLVVLIHEMYELGIEPTFFQQAAVPAC